MEHPWPVGTFVTQESLPRDLDHRAGRNVKLRNVAVCQRRKSTIYLQFCVCFSNDPSATQSVKPQIVVEFSVPNERTFVPPGGASELANKLFSGQAARFEV